MEQLSLGLGSTVGVTLCGYCLRPLTQQPVGDWSCNRCRPLLAEIGTVEQWARFQREAWASRRRLPAVSKP